MGVEVLGSRWGLGIVGGGYFFRSGFKPPRKLGLNLPKFGVFGHFLEFESLDFSNFAYYDRQA